ncbi:phospholipid methyltransferase [Candidatus Formimonas warabiya]|uniref:Phospholipid methyltransferase n=1 Tax=Formimonas warabiya TaxID=1761012 RepID=A0A3G1L1H7_FORW1|nr:isoprenylcysteine carboxylmethyltransferase family protein [Candidatus Formimonas warabiya]ATW28511.1 phospholipid methyltransferase [Candidatus Formimonas warabiya]
MNGFILVLPIILIRYCLLGILSKEAAKRAAFFPPTEGKEKIAFWIYQITTLSLMIILIFLKIKLNHVLNFIGLGTCIIGIILYMIAMIHFAKPDQNGLNAGGLYKISRNPMYLAFFLYFLGGSMLTSSWLLLFILMIFQISVHYLILSEERWCIKEFGEEYKNYMNTVKRYL